MKKLRILIDVDGIIADSLPYWLGHIGLWSSDKGRQQGTWAKVSDIKVWDLCTCPPLDTLDDKYILGMWNLPYFAVNVPVMFGAQEAIQRLADDGHELYFVTARTGSVSIGGTFEWFHKHFPKVNTERQLVFLYDKHLLEADVIIDDKPTTLVTYKNTFPKALTVGVRYPYNEHLEASHKLFGSENYESHALTWGGIYGCISAHAERQNKSFYNWSAFPKPRYDPPRDPMELK